MPNEKDKRVKVGFLIPSIHYGGGEVWTYNLIKFANSDLVTHTICVVTDSWCTDSLLNKMAATIPVYYSGFIYHRHEKTKSSLEDAVCFLRNNSDVVVTWELDDSRFSMVDGIDGQLVHVIIRKDIGHSRFVRENQHLAAVSDNCIEFFGTVEKSRIKVIPVGIDLNRCFPIMNRKAIRDSWGLSNDNIVVGFLGRIDPVKNCRAVARTVRGMDGRGIAICYGAKNFEIEKIQTELYAIAGNKLKWYEPVEDIGSVLSGFDVLMLPSYTEVFSLTLLEAWGAGIPVIATLVGETPVLMKKYGDIVISIDPEAPDELLVQAVERSLSDNHQRLMRAQKMVFDNYNIIKIANEWSNYFYSIFTQSLLENTNGIDQELN